jgi:uncharacterized protein (DUF433 family)
MTNERTSPNNLSARTEAPSSGHRTHTRVIVSDPEVMSGTPVFAGTRVPVRALIDYLAAGDPLDDFLDQFPTVTRDRAVAALEEMAELALETARAHPS